jgi:hypothetical protein
LIKTIKDTKITATVVDKTKINTTTGKPLQNSESSLEISSTTIALGDLSNFLGGLKDANLGNTIASAGIGGVILSAAMGNSFSFLAKFILIIEFLTLTQLFNVNYDYILEELFNVLGSFTEITFMSLKSEQILGA